MKYVMIRSDGAHDNLWLALVEGKSVVKAMRDYTLVQGQSGWHASTPHTTMFFQDEGAKVIAKAWLESMHVMS